MNIKDIFTADELALIDSGNYKPGRAVLDAKLDLVAAAEREACAKVAEDMDAMVLALLNVTRQPIAIAAAIRARRQA